jgi:hypothetical protein
MDYDSFDAVLHWIFRSVRLVFLLAKFLLISF